MLCIDGVAVLILLCAQSVDYFTKSRERVSYLFVPIAVGCSSCPECCTCLSVCDLQWYLGMIQVSERVCEERACMY